MDSAEQSLNTRQIARPDSDPIVVGIGTSAGGVEALEVLFSEMPTDLNMAYVVIQHLSARYESLMPEILGRRTTMPIVAIESNIRLRPNHVYVLQTGQDVIVAGNQLHAQPHRKSSAAHRPIDQFFRSLANDAGERAIGVVLSGTGNDGARGVCEIHNAGGLVVVQSEDSARYGAMPRAANETGVADVVADVGVIPRALQDLGAKILSAGSGRKDDDQSVDSVRQQILQLLRQKFSINFDHYKTALIERRLERRLMLNDETDYQSYLRRLQDNEDELLTLYKNLLIGVTHFFRDPIAFEALQRDVLPQMFDAVDETGVVRVWVTSCATGDEAYSIAILLDELNRQREAAVDFKVFATDVNPQCIEAASRGYYSEESLANVSAKRKDRYFKRTDKGYQVCNSLQKKIVFAEHNALDDAPFTKLDLVCCRNLLIYLKPVAKKKALSLFNFGLNDSGVLFLGPSENVDQLPMEFETINDACRLFRKVAPVDLSRVPDLKYTRLPENRTGMTGDEESRYGSGRLRPVEMLGVYDQLLSEFIPPGLLIDSANQIKHIFGDASKFLSFRNGRPPSDFLQLLPETLRIAATNGLKRARADRTTVVYAGLRCDFEGVTATYRLQVKPLATRIGLYHLLTIDCVDNVASTADQTVLDDRTASADRIRSLEEELSDARESLHGSILDLKSANEEMQSTNEELIASNEELQSTNEELHSVNEELYTVNAEHQRKITELTEMTDDMENLLDGIRVDTIFLDRELQVRKFTLGIARTFRLMPEDVGRNIDSFNHALLCDNLVDQIRSVIQNEHAIEEEVQDRSKNWYLMRLLPYTSKGRVDGALLTLIDISRIKLTEQRLAQLSEIVETSEDAILRIAPDGTIGTWNRGATKLFTYLAPEVMGKHVDLLASDSVGQQTISSALQKIADRIHVDHLDMKAVRRDGQPLDVQMSISPIYNSNGELEAASLVMRDVTMQKKAEADNIDAVRRRDQFLAMLSHELRNPVAAIMNALALLRRENLDEDRDTMARDVIMRHSKQLSKLLDDLLEVSRITHDKINLDSKPLDLVSLANEVLECVESKIERKNLNLTVDLPRQPVHIVGDAVRIVQAQANLLVNATRYTHEGGNIHYSIGCHDDLALIRVKDDGEGMSQSFKEKIFEVFVQADQPLDRTQGGLGLGLPIVQMIVEAHGGEVAVESQGVGKGSTFELRFPMTAAIPEQEITRIEGLPKSLQQTKLLLVEDNDSARIMLAEYLDVEGFDVTTAANGIEALDAFEQSNPDVCVFDIGLPDLDGFEVAKRIIEAGSKPKLLIALTGYGQEKDRNEAIETGFDLHVVKPIDPDELVSLVVEKLIEQSGTIATEPTVSASSGA